MPKHGRRFRVVAREWFSHTSKPGHDVLIEIQEALERITWIRHVCVHHEQMREVQGLLSTAHHSIECMFKEVFHDPIPHGSNGCRIPNTCPIPNMRLP